MCTAEHDAKRWLGHVWRSSSMSRRCARRAPLPAGRRRRGRRRRGSHRLLVHSDGRTLVFALHDGERVGPKLLAKILKDARIPRPTSGGNCRRTAQSASESSQDRAGWAGPGAVLGLFSCPPPSTNAHDATRKVAVSSVQNAHLRRFASPKLESHSRGRGFDSPRLHFTIRSVSTLTTQPRTPEHRVGTCASSARCFARRCAACGPCADRARESHPASAARRWLRPPHCPTSVRSALGCRDGPARGRPRASRAVPRGDSQRDRRDGCAALRRPDNSNGAESLRTAGVIAH